jgi:twitching motility two-component system response regulator PilH
MSKILVVDDSPAETHQFIVMLELMGHEVSTAGDGRDGVKMAIAEQPDVVLMDIVMPDMNGFQATR